MQAAAHHPTSGVVPTGFSPRLVPIRYPPCACSDCQTYYYSAEAQGTDRYNYTATRTDDEARRILARYAKDIYQAQEYLRKAVQQNGDCILARWEKRTQTQRANLLTQVEPHLPKRKGLAADLQHSGASWHTHREQKYRKYHLLPYLDTNTLTKNSSMLIGLIDTRTKEDAQDWAPFDHEQIKFAWGSGLLNTEFNANAVIMFGSNYGELVEWKAKAAHRFDIVGFPRAQLIFEAQATLLQFLRQVVQQLLEDPVVPNQMCTKRWDKLINSGLKMNGETASWSKFINQPFTTVPRFDIDSLVDQVRARSDATNDHLWLLQTEPAYMKRYMRKLSQMQSVESSGKPAIGLIIMNGEIIGDITTNWFWRCTLVEFEELQKIYPRDGDMMATRAPLPAEVDNMLGALEVILINRIHLRSKEIYASISQQPGFRDMYDFSKVSTDAHGKAYQIRISIKKKFTTNDHGALAYRTKRLWWTVFQLTGDPEAQNRFRYTMLLDMLDDQLKSSPLARRERLDELFYEKLSDFATLLEILSAVRMHCPRNRNRTFKNCETTEDRVFWRTSGYGHNTQNYDTGATIGFLKEFQAAKLPGGAQNAGWLRRFDHLHGTFQKYWQQMSKVYRSTYTGYGLMPEDVNFNMRSMLFWEHKEYRNSLKEKHDQVLHAQKARIPDSGDIFLPLPTTAEPTIKPDFQPAKTKLKTRGESITGVNGRAETNIGSHAIQDTPFTTLSLPKRSTATFRYMFPATAEERSKPVDWDIFVDSMADAGFSARNGGGSIVSFGNNDGGKINFHRPHPEPQIDPIMLRSMGRRMNKWFGWTRATFV